MAEMDFPPVPTLGQKYTAPSGIVYEWDGYGWVIGYYDAATQQLQSVGDFLDQVRILLQDTDNTSGQYRYTTESIILCLNQGMIDLYRMRPDIFVPLKFVIPFYNSGHAGCRDWYRDAVRLAAGVLRRRPRPDARR